MDKDIIILGIESSCDDTSAAVIRDGILLSNVIASQSVHEEYGGVPWTMYFFTGRPDLVKLHLPGLSQMKWELI